MAARCRTASEAEEYLLSCCLLDGSDTIARCLEARLPPAAFYSPANSLIYEKLCELYQVRPPVELAVLAEELKTAKQLEAVGGYAYLTQISARIPTTAQAGYFLEKDRELHLLREQIKAATGAVERAFNYQAARGIRGPQVEQDIFSVTQARISDAAKPMKEPTREAMNVITKMMMKKASSPGWLSGSRISDALTFGFQRQEMIVLCCSASVDGQDEHNLQHRRGRLLLPKRGEPITTLVFSLGR